MELKAYSELTQRQLTLWQINLLMRLDDMALSTWREAGPTAVESKPEQRAVETSDDTGRSVTLIPVSNVKALKQMMRGIAARKNEKYGNDEVDD